MKRRTLISGAGLTLAASPIFALEAIEKQQRLGQLQSQVQRSSDKWSKLTRKKPNIVTFPSAVAATRQPDGKWLVGTKAAPLGEFFDRANFPVQLIVAADENFVKIITKYEMLAEKSNSHFVNFKCNLNFGVNTVYLRLVQPEITNLVTVRKAPHISRSIPVSDLLKVAI